MKKKTQKVSLLTGIIALSLAAIHIVNKIIFFTCTLKEILYRENSHYYSWRFGKISYTRKGSGAPILLIHDLAATSSGYEFKELENTLSKTNTVYTIDLIGFGRSEKPKMIYTNYLYVQLISDFIKNVINEKTTVVTSRRSCAISIMACYIDQALFDHLILINPTDLKVLNKYPKKKHKIIKCILDIPVLGTLIYNIKNNKFNIKRKFYSDYLSAPYPVIRYENAFSEAAHTSGSASKCVYTSITCHYTNTNITQALRNIKNPINIIAGSDVPNIETVIDDYQRYNATINADYISHTKGMPQIEKPSKCVDLIKSFLE